MDRRILLGFDLLVTLFILGPRILRLAGSGSRFESMAILCAISVLSVVSHLLARTTPWRHVVLFSRVAFVPFLPFLIPMPAMAFVSLVLSAQFLIFHCWPFVPAIGIALFLLGAVGHVARLRPYGPDWASMAPGSEWFSFMTVCVLGGLGMAAGAFQWHKRRSELDLLARERLASTELAEANVRLQELAAQQEEFATLKERNRLARDIHDTVGHSLTAIIVQLEGILSIMAEEPARAAAAVQRARDVALAAMQEVRHSVATLRLPTMEQERGRKLWERVARTFAECTNVMVTTDIRGDFADISQVHNEVVVRAIEEGLTNAVRHGQASRVDVGVCWRDGCLMIRISDNGRGVKGLKEGHGLQGLRERVRALGGDIAWRSAPGFGFDLGIDIPLKEGGAYGQDQSDVG